jgi:hypothetical protein
MQAGRLVPVREADTRHTALWRLELGSAKLAGIGGNSKGRGNPAVHGLIWRAHRLYFRSSKNDDCLQRAPILELARRNPGVRTRGDNRWALRHRYDRRRRATNGLQG